jgi:hypothetical protein
MPLSRSERMFHRKLGTHCFNEAWTLLEDRTRDEAGDRRMLNLAHTSRHHWGVVGGPREQAIGDWQLSRVYSSINEPELALHFAEACLATCQEEALRELLSTAYEALARAHGTAGRSRFAREFIHKARDALDAAPVGAEDRKAYLHQIRDTERKIG